MDEVSWPDSYYVLHVASGVILLSIITSQSPFVILLSPLLTGSTYPLSDNPTHRTSPTAQTPKYEGKRSPRGLRVGGRSGRSEPPSPYDMMLLEPKKSPAGWRGSGAALGLLRGFSKVPRTSREVSGIPRPRTGTSHKQCCPRGY